ncbi:MAG: response regulator [Candidatus Heimdallarchaeota archaeon]
MNKIRVLLVDDELNLLKVTKLYLEKLDHSLDITTATTSRKAMELLNKEPFDVVISDYQMPETDGLALLKEVRMAAIDIPFIIFTGRGREDVVIKALNLGADFYLQKGGDVSSQFSELVNLIKKAFEKRLIERTLRKSEEKFSKAFNFSYNSMAIIRFQDASFQDINQQFTRMFSYTQDELVGKTFEAINFWAKKDDYIKFKELLREKNEVSDFETLLMTKEKQLIPVQISATLIDIEGDLCVLMIIKDISEISKMIEILRESEFKYKLIFEESPVAFLNLNLFDVRIKLESLPKEHLKSLLKTPQENIGFFGELIKMIKINDLNNLALRAFEVSTKEEFYHCLHQKLFLKNFEIFSTIIQNLFFRELPIFNRQITLTDCLGKEKQVLLSVREASKTKDTWSNILISIIELETLKLI